MNNIDKKPYIFGISGKIASGKDTVASLVVSRIGESVHLSFADDLKKDVSLIVKLIQENKNPETISEVMNEDVFHINYMINALKEDVKNNVFNDAYGKKPQSLRNALQYWGNAVKRAKDEDYWVNKSTEKALKYFDDNYNVYFTDCRFPNEVEALIKLGFPVFRLLVSEEKQKERVLARDGFPMTEEARLNFSETALDDKNYLFNEIYDTDLLKPEYIADSIYKFLMKGLN